jgi:hypothetical protein
MTQLRVRKLIQILVLISVGFAPRLAASQQVVTDKTSILSTARQKYYNLKDAGLVQFQVNIQPNWDVVLGDAGVKSNNRALLNGLRFSCSIDPEGKLRIDYRAEVPPRDQASADSVARIFKSMEDALRWFFRAWSIFSFTSPFPEVGSDYTIQKREHGYQLSQRQAELFVEVDADNDFMISEIRVTGSQLTASLKPVLESTPAGFLLKGYTANSQRSSGARATTVKALLEYETVSGLQLLRRVSLDTTFEGVPAKIEWVFTDYQVKVR